MAGSTVFFPKKDNIVKVEFNADDTWTVPLGVETIFVSAIGGGAGGASREYSLDGIAFPSSVNPGGSSGFVVNSYMPVTPGEILTVTVGLGGAAGGGTVGSGTLGGSGGNSSVAGASQTLTAEGGTNSNSLVVTNTVGGTDYSYRQPLSFSRSGSSASAGGLVINTSVNGQSSAYATGGVGSGSYGGGGAGFGDGAAANTSAQPNTGAGGGGGEPPGGTNLAGDGGSGKVIIYYSVNR